MDARNTCYTRPSTLTSKIIPYEERPAGAPVGTCAKCCGGERSHDTSGKAFDNCQVHGDCWIRAEVRDATPLLSHSALSTGELRTVVFCSWPEMRALLRCLFPYDRSSPIGPYIRVNAA